MWRTDRLTMRHVDCGVLGERFSGSSKFGRRTSGERRLGVRRLDLSAWQGAFRRPRFHATATRVDCLAQAAGERLDMEKVYKEWRKLLLIPGHRCGRDRDCGSGLTAPGMRQRVSAWFNL